MQSVQSFCTKAIRTIKYNTDEIFSKKRETMQSEKMTKRESCEVYLREESAEGGRR